MQTEFDAVFARLRGVLQANARGLDVSEDSQDKFCLDGKVGPTMLKLRGPRPTDPAMPVAWVERRKNYVSFHLMPVYTHPKLAKGLSPALGKRMQGKSCFNFRTVAEIPVGELEALTRAGCAKMKQTGFIL